MTDATTSPLTQAMNDAVAPVPASVAQSTIITGLDVVHAPNPAPVGTTPAAEPVGTQAAATTTNASVTHNVVAVPLPAAAAKGFKTTEFWLTASAMVAIMLNQSGVLGSFQLSPDIVYTLAGLLLAYMGSRFGLKVTAGADSGKQVAAVLRQLQALQDAKTAK